MTSSSYVTSSLLRTTTAFHQKQIPTAGVRHTQKISLSNPKQLSMHISDQQNAYEEQTFLLSRRRYDDDATPFTHSFASRQTTRKSKNDAHIKPFSLLRTDLLTHNNCTPLSLDAHFGLSNSGQLPIPDGLCSSNLENQNISGGGGGGGLKSAPTHTSSCSVRNLSTRYPGSSDSTSTRETMKVSYPAAKGGESSWHALCRNSSGNSGVNQTRVFPQVRDNLSRIFHAVYNFQGYRDFIIRKGYFGKKTMSLGLLLDPIVGSPPSALSSPLVEARDDISALSEGFTRKVKLHRRRLSTSFDEPSHYDSGNSADAGRVVSSAAADASLEHVGPFGFRSKGRVSKLHFNSGQQDNDCDEKKQRQLNAWLEQLHQEAISKGDSGAGESKFSNDEGNEESSHGSSHDDDDNESSSKPTSPAFRISEDLFQLLEKVIGCKGRNISHITVEQSVKHLCTVYMDAHDDDKLKFFTILAEKYGVDHDYVTATASSLVSCKDDEVRLTLEEKLRGALVPKSQWLFTQIGRLENGVKFLVDVRVDLLDAIEASKGKSSLKALNNSLRDLIGMWFNVGFLNLERVTWQSSCDMLQKISEYEAVHPMRNWTDLKKRVGPNRRCFVFTHNSMPGEPVVVLHTFLTDHIASSVQKIVSNHRMRMMSLDSELPLASMTEDPDAINTAVFYSITSTQRGLTGIELGNYLIKRVVRELQSEFPKLTQFSTLSPIPGFKNWLASSIKGAMKESTTTGKSLLTEGEIKALQPIFETYNKEKNFYEVFLDVLKLNSWFSDEKLVKELEKPLMRLCAQYLYLVKRRGYALDPVANFHLKNGAVIWRINWLGDESPRGLGQSCGMMVNYRYFLETCESNSQNYMESQLIHISDQVKHFIKLTAP